MTVEQEFEKWHKGIEFGLLETELEKEAYKSGYESGLRRAVEIVLESGEPKKRCCYRFGHYSEEIAESIQSELDENRDE